MTDEAKTTEEVQFPLNKTLLEESSKIKEERKVIKERISKIDGSRGNVSDSVYEKVRKDYIDQLEENTNALLEKKQDIDRELATLYEAKKKVEENVNVHREKLEEINFRHNLGEYEKKDYSKLADEENEKLGKFEKILAAINSNIEEYESLFKNEEDLMEEEISEAPPPPPPSDETNVEAPISIGEGTGEDYDVGEGEDYFGAVTEEVEVPEKDKPVPEDTQDSLKVEPLSEVTGKIATIEIIEGDGKGDKIELSEDESTIGRASSNTVVLKEAKVSRQHASIKRQGSEYLLTDLHSSNGVFVNDEKINEHALSDGDEIRIGDFLMKFRY